MADILLGLYISMYNQSQGLIQFLPIIYLSNKFFYFNYSETFLLNNVKRSGSMIINHVILLWWLKEGIQHSITPMMNLDLLAHIRFRSYKWSPWYSWVDPQSDKMLSLNYLYPALVAIWILPRDIRCNGYNVVDVDPDIVWPIRRSTQEPGGRPDIPRSGIEYNETILPAPEPISGKQLMKKYEPAYQGVQNYTD